MSIDREEMVRKLRTYTCREHNKHATVMYEGDALEITACCDSFLKELEKVVAEENFRHGSPIQPPPQNSL